MGETLSYDVLLNRIENGSKWHFRLTANPTRSSHEKDSDERGKVYAEVSEKYLMEWLMRKAKLHGFKIIEDTAYVTQIKWFHFRKNKSGHYVNFKSTTFEGELLVENREKFIDALIHGIGREKSYGMGLLTIAR